MIDRMLEALPEPWRGLVQLLAAPIAWLPHLQQALAAYFAESSSLWAAVLKYVFLALPAGLGVVALWCTQLSLYSLPFRSGRARFVSLLLLAWWDAGRVVWLYWLGTARLVAVVVGWVFALGQLAARLLAAVATAAAAGPSAIRTRLNPWSLGAGLLVGWCALEAVVFTHTVRPTMSRVVADIVGGDDGGRLVGPLLFLALLVLVMGSFACLHALADAARRRQWSLLAQVVAVQAFVMFFEVMFLYRPVVRAMAPWFGEPADRPLGLALTLAVAAGGWIGVRGLTWFLFGRYGTARVLALVTRQPLAELGAPAPAPGAAAPAWWRPAVAEFRRDIDWLHTRSEEALEFVALPALQLLAAGLNFAMILAVSRPVFTLPFAGLRHVTEQREMEGTLHLTPRKSASA